MICDMFLRVVSVIVVVVVVVGVNCLTNTPRPTTEPPPFPLPSPQHPPQDVQKCGTDASCQSSRDLIRCQCDPLCNIYGDCCYDSEFRNVSLHQVTDEGRGVKCYGYDRQALARTRCMEGWSDAEVEDLCVSGGMHTDPISTLPVTSKATGHTYQNYYCAICNGDILDLRIWNLLLSCDERAWRDGFHLKDLVLRNNSWGVMRETPESQVFFPCDLYPDVPEDVENLTRNCSLSTISTCSEDWHNKDIEALCHSYSLLVDKDFETYKNMYCLMCNRMDFEKFDCQYIAIEEDLPFPILFDISDRSHGNLVGSSSPCSATQVWDPFFKRCRSIVCPKPNQEYSYGKCVTLGDDKSNKSSEPPTTSRMLISSLLLYLLVLIMPSSV